jgi:hypothetical protein
MAGHKKGSNALACGLGFLLLALGVCIGFGLFTPDFRDATMRKIVNAGSSSLFGIVLLWWVMGEDRTWGIGFESVTMIVGVVTAVIAILTLTHGG